MASVYSFWNIGVTVRTPHGFLFLTLSHILLSASFNILFLSVCPYWCNFIILQRRSATGYKAGGIKSFLFVFQLDFLTTSIFPSFIRFWLSTSPFSLFRALCILFETVSCCLANEKHIGKQGTTLTAAYSSLDSVKCVMGYTQRFTYVEPQGSAALHGSSL